MAEFSLPVVESYYSLLLSAKKANLNISSDSRLAILFNAIKRLGPERTEKNIAQLIDGGKAQWNDQQEFEVEEIIDYVKEENGEEFYYIKWLGWPEKYNTWEPRENLDCYDVIMQFHHIKKQQKKAVKRKRSEPENVKIDKKELVQDLVNTVMKSGESESLYMAIIKAHHNLTWRHKDSADCLYSNGNNGNRNITKACGSKPVPQVKVKMGKKALKADVQKAIAEWQKKINEVNKDPAKIFVENKVDLEGPPANFTYITDYIAGKGVEIPSEPIIGCECESCTASSDCCPKKAGVDFPYYKNCRRTRLHPGQPIYECNSRCKCGPECPNRVVQLGRRHKVCIYRTKMKGWGVRTLQKIKQGSFVMEYVGEVITNEEAERRGEKYDAEGHTFLFDLDYSDSENAFTVDAGRFGNVAHFVNHSCDPNLVVYGVWINHLDYRLPRIALFAKRDIEAEEELTFDYLMTSSREVEDGLLDSSLIISNQPEEAHDAEDKDDCDDGALNSHGTNAEEDSVAGTNNQENKTNGLAVACEVNGDNNTEYNKETNLVSDVTNKIEEMDTETKSEDSGLSSNGCSEEINNFDMLPDEKEIIKQEKIEPEELSSSLVAADMPSSVLPVEATNMTNSISMSTINNSGEVVITEKSTSQQLHENNDKQLPEKVASHVSDGLGKKASAEKFSFQSPIKNNRTPDKAQDDALLESPQKHMFRNRKTPKALKYHIRCQCGAKNCRQYLC